MQSCAAVMNVDKKKEGEITSAFILLDATYSPCLMQSLRA